MRKYGALLCGMRRTGAGSGSLPDTAICIESKPLIVKDKWKERR